MDQRKVDVSQKEKESGATVLMYASMNGNAELVKILLGLGADLDAKDSIHGWTALMQAIFYGQKNVAELLLQAGADPTLCAKNGMTALDLAVLMDDTNPDMIHLLATETISAAPPSMLFWPASRPGTTRLARSVSTPTMLNQDGKRSNPLKTWWGKISSRFKTEDKIQQLKFSSQSNENVEESDFETGQGLTQVTFGFNANLNENGWVTVVQPPESKPLITLSKDDSKAKWKRSNVIDTRKLLSNFHRRQAPRNVKEFLQKSDLLHCWPIFQQHEIDLKALQLLTKSDLVEMGIKDEKAFKIFLNKDNFH